MDDVSAVKSVTICRAFKIHCRSISDLGVLQNDHLFNSTGDSFHLAYLTEINNEARC